MNILKVRRHSEIPENYTGITEYPNGTKVWYLNGLCHRVDGPALEYLGGYKEWWLNGQRHRVNGPAIESFNGSKAWYLKGIEYSQEEWFEQLVKIKW
jgi:hypothetical protein